MLQQMMQNNPQMRAQMDMVMQNPQMLQMMMNPDTIRAVANMQRMFSGMQPPAAGGAAAGGAGGGVAAAQAAAPAQPAADRFVSMCVCVVYVFDHFVSCARVFLNILCFDAVVVKLVCKQQISQLVLLWTSICRFDKRVASLTFLMAQRI